MRIGLDREIVGGCVKQGKVLIGMCLAAFALAGCVAPGMHMNAFQLTPAVNAQNQVTKPVIYKIDAQLVQAQNAAANRKKQQARIYYHRPAGFYTNTAYYRYRVAPQDVLNVIVWNQSVSSTDAQVGNSLAGGMSTAAAAGGASANNASNTYRVDGNGTIFYPYLGKLNVARKTVSQIQSMLVHKLAKYIDNPQVTVQVMGFNSQKIAVTGAVSKPMNVPITNVPLNVLTAINDAGGPISCTAQTAANTATFCADVHDVEVRRGNKIVTVNLNKLTAANGSSNNWLLQDNDIVYVPNNNDSRVFVMGAANSPGSYNMIDGKMTLRDALGDAGGVNASSNPGYTYVIRNYKANPQIFELNLASPDALNLAGDFSLKPSDVVFISTSRLQDATNIINQITPLLTLAVFAHTVTNW